MARVGAVAWLGGVSLARAFAGYVRVGGTRCASVFCSIGLGARSKGAQEQTGCTAETRVNLPYSRINIPYIKPYILAVDFKILQISHKVIPLSVKLQAEGDLLWLHSMPFNLKRPPRTMWREYST